MNRLARTLLSLLVFTGLGLQGSAVLAQGAAARPITLVVPYPPGGSADILARAIGQKLGERLKQTVIVDNKPGAGTAIGSRFVAEAAPDGHTLLLGTVSSHAINPAMTKVGYDPIRDFAVVTPLVSIPFVLVTRADSPYQKLADVIAAASQKPQTLGYASAGPGTSNHLAGEMFASATRTQLMHVPYRGSAPALADVIAGHVPLMFDLQATAAPNIRQGKLRALAVSALERSALLPDVPTMSESGLPGFEVSAWFALLAPAKVPADTLKRLETEMAAVMQAPDMALRMRELGGTPDRRSAAAFSAYMRDEAKKYADVVKAAGLSP
ncbi:MAG: tripartite tricarboxylate transporter substrate binding protein [Betaproteobacteria bacterium]